MMTSFRNRIKNKNSYAIVKSISEINSFAESFFYCSYPILVLLLYFASSIKVAGAVAQIDELQFILLSLASVLIAAAGYIINDYFDVNIDQVNKPKKNVVDLIVSRRWAISLAFCIKRHWCFAEFIYIVENRALVYRTRQFWVCFFIIRIFDLAQTKIAVRKYSDLGAYFLGHTDAMFVRISAIPGWTK